jgi:16S rRNA processing protein RimM
MSGAQATDDWIAVGRIGRPHGIKGQVTVEVRTDVPEVRFADGARLLRTDGPPVEIVASQWHQGTLLLTIAGVHDRSQAEALRDTWLHIDGSQDTYVDGDPDSFADHDLVGLAVVLEDGTAVGEVTEVLHPPGQDLLAVRRGSGEELLLPFVLKVVPTVDLTAGRVVITPPAGLLDL